MIVTLIQTIKVFFDHPVKTTKVTTLFEQAVFGAAALNLLNLSWEVKKNETELGCEYIACPIRKDKKNKIIHVEPLKIILEPIPFSSERTSTRCAIIRVHENHNRPIIPLPRIFSRSDLETVKITRLFMERTKEIFAHGELNDTVVPS